MHDPYADTRLVPIILSDTNSVVCDCYASSSNLNFDRTRSPKESVPNNSACRIEIDSRKGSQLEALCFDVGIVCQEHVAFDVFVDATTGTLKCTLRCVRRIVSSWLTPFPRVFAGNSGTIAHHFLTGLLWRLPPIASAPLEHGLAAHRSRSSAAGSSRSLRPAKTASAIWRWRPLAECFAIESPRFDLRTRSGA